MQTEYTVDFGSISEIAKQLNNEEIKKLNNIFEDEEIKKILTQNQAILDQKYSEYVVNAARKKQIRPYITSFLIAGSIMIIAYLALTMPEMIPVVCIASCIVVIVGFYSCTPPIPSAPWDTNLQQRVIQKLIKIIHPQLEFNKTNSIPNPDAVLGLNDITTLASENFLSIFKEITKYEDILTLKTSEFDLHGAEIHTIYPQRKKSVHNDVYLLKLDMHHANIITDASVQVFLRDDIIKIPSLGLIGFIGRICLLPLYILCIIMFFTPWIIIMSLIWGILSSMQQPEYLWILYFLIGPISFFFYSRALIRGWMGHHEAHHTIETEQNIFDTIYGVVSTDEIAGRMIVNPAFMDRLMCFREKTHNRYSFLFLGNTIWIKQDLGLRNEKFDINGANMSENIKKIGEFYIDLREIFSLISDLKLLYFSKPSKEEGLKF